jgi:hypothetical protein
MTRTRQSLTHFDLGLAGLTLAIAAWALLATAVLSGLVPLATVARPAIAASDRPCPPKGAPPLVCLAEPPRASSR